MIAAGAVGGLLAAIFGFIDWLAMSVLFGGINTLVLPLQVGKSVSQNNQATVWDC